MSSLRVSHSPWAAAAMEAVMLSRAGSLRLVAGSSRLMRGWSALTP